MYAREIDEAVMLGGIHFVGHAFNRIVRRRPARRKRTGRRNVFHISFPGQAFFGHLVHEASGGDVMVGVTGLVRLFAKLVLDALFAKKRIVIVDSECVAPQHGDVIGLAGMHFGVKLRRAAVFRRQLVDDWRPIADAS